MSAPKTQPQTRGKVKIKPLPNKGELEFVASRRNTVFQTLKKLQIPCSRREVPNIALLGSGGGQRAMVGLLGSLVELDKAGLLDCMLYLSGVSGSTWCMASLYKEPNWSTKLETVKDKIIERLKGPGVSLMDKLEKLKKYYYGKKFFSLTDFWAAMIVTLFVKEIDEQALTEQRDQHNKDPFPIYTVIDKQFQQASKDAHLSADPWFEINPHEAGYSLTGAFVDTSDFGSPFHEGSKKDEEGEFDMLYLQGLCGSAIADEQQIKEYLWQNLKGLIKEIKTRFEATGKESGRESLMKVENEDFENTSKVISPPEDKSYQVLMDLVDMNLCALEGKDTSGLDESIRKNLNELSGGNNQGKKEETTEMRKINQDIRSITMDVCNNLIGQNILWPFDAVANICKCIPQWIWGRKYNFLHNMTDGAVPAALLQNETRDYIDAGLLNNSPYFSVLRKDRDIDLIISLDFSAGDPFMTVNNAAATCRKLKIPFPEVKDTSQDKDKPKDFYVFKGKNVPTVIHIPLFNVVNCGDKLTKWQEDYSTFQRSFDAEMITNLMEVAGKNISNNREKLLVEIRAAVEKKRNGRFTLNDK
ncbi:cytosolic phospholipase A2 gamma-like isoform X2 [Garra rufa]|uniref:cytosolic phospholipase A2 gamma-like isoform X2 n=1 Tax=Garra rufa TaxID=137080 RepID=UPI003CCEB55B